MFTRLSDVDRTFSLMDELRRRMDRGWDREEAYAPRALSQPTWPLVNLFDTGGELVLTADVPGLAEKDIKITLDGETLTLAGERQIAALEGATCHRQERAGVKFSRSFSLPVKADAERATAEVKDGVLRLTLPKAPEARPRQIAVRTS